VWGIDAPEKDETGYKVSGWFLESLLKGSELSCKFIYKDKYKRDVMHCFTNEVDIGSEMVRFGLAKDFKKYSGGYYRPEEEAAKKALKGIWSVKNGK
jgi:micrococcal nuclease